jgi:hypothetical protein
VLPASVWRPTYQASKVSAVDTKKPVAPAKKLAASTKKLSAAVGTQKVTTAKRRKVTDNIDIDSPLVLLLPHTRATTAAKDPGPFWQKFSACRPREWSDIWLS